MITLRPVARDTILLKQGVHQKIVQERLGHSSISTTLDIYSHVVPRLQDAAAKHFDDGLPGISLQNREYELAQRLESVVGTILAILPLDDVLR